MVKLILLLFKIMTRTVESNYLLVISNLQNI